VSATDLRAALAALGAAGRLRLAARPAPATDIPAIADRVNALHGAGSRYDAVDGFPDWAIVSHVATDRRSIRPAHRCARRHCAPTRWTCWRCQDCPR
jgi:hypothetical protein